MHTEQEQQLIAKNTELLDELRAKNRALDIEAALEKVRARSIAMQKSDDLLEVIKIVTEQLAGLGLSFNLTNFAKVHAEGSWDIWMSSPEQAYPVFIHVPYLDHRLFNITCEVIAKGIDFSSEVYPEEEKNIFFRHFFENTRAKNTPEAQKQAMYKTKGLSRSIFLTKNIWLSVSRYNAVTFTEEENVVFKRFANVFEQSYTRFLDLQQAELQAREGQIQLALEKVRARTMAMQKSDELAEAAVILFQQLNTLGLELRGCGFNIWEKDEKICTAWMSGPEGSLSTPFKLPLTELPFFIRYYQSRQNGEDFWVHETGKEELAARYRYLHTLPVIGELLANDPREGVEPILPDRVVDHVANFSNGNLIFITYKPCPEGWDIFKRFAKVFEQTYTRFLDLQKAEAQAREAQVEAALERVRSRTMAMHQSDELEDVTILLFKQVTDLGIKTWTTGFNIWSDDNNSYTDYITNPQGGFIDPYTIDASKSPVFRKMSEAKKRGDEFLVNFEEGEELEETYRQLIKAGEKQFNELLESGFPFPTKQYEHVVFGAKVSLLFITYEPVPVAHDIFRRFGKVFEQTYTRFLDLQKAEGQAREAQIETSLERVRSKAMAMHKSEDLHGAVATVFEELDKLNLGVLRIGISVLNKEKRNGDVWLTSVDNDKPVQVYGNESFDFHPLMQGSMDAWIRQEDFYYILEGEDLTNYYNALKTAQFGLPASQVLSAGNENKKQSCYVAVYNAGGLFAFREGEFPQEAKTMMKRFAKVFDLTYKRFLDLQKAEAQAREAQIEATLEKVRGKAMAMRNSNDLSATASLVFTELRNLGIRPIRCGVGLLSKETRKGQLYSATSSAEGESLSLMGWVQLSGHTILQKIYDTWLVNEDYFPELQGESLNEYYQLLLAGLSVKVPDWQSGQKQYGTFLQISVGCLYAWSATPYNPDEIKILKRFANIIDLTFRRYIELQKTEANVREALKQATLDRIRANIASMRTVSDLERITPLIWNELKILRVSFIRCGVFIMDDAQQLIHTFLSTPDGKAIAAFHLPYDTPGNLGLVLRHWRANENYIAHWDEAAFIVMAGILLKQGAIASPEQYLSTIPQGGFYLHFLPFLQGMLNVGNLTRLSEEEIKLIQSVADAFSTAYARYEDFNKLEAAKKQVDSTLNELQATQKQLIHAEKMASLGELTAGIAHEIQNPLNFVNNFSDVNKELLVELIEEAEKGNMDEVKTIARDIIGNEDKINHHGKRADSIVKGMLQHSRSSSATKEPTDINELADEFIRLSYHGLRAKNKNFNALPIAIGIKTDFDSTLEKINIIPQDIGRVLLNLFNNAFYAALQTAPVTAPLPPEGGFKEPDDKHIPTVWVSTKKVGDKVLISVRDNGPGIPKNIIDKIFQPFFTTKPTGEGTGLGLSLSYDIVKAHGGDIKVETVEARPDDVVGRGQGTEFIVTLNIT